MPVKWWANTEKKHQKFWMRNNNKAQQKKLANLAKIEKATNKWSQLQDDKLHMSTIDHSGQPSSLAISPTLHIRCILLSTVHAMPWYAWLCVHRKVYFILFLAKKGLPPHFLARLFNALQNQCLLDGVKANGSDAWPQQAAPSWANKRCWRNLAKTSWICVSARLLWDVLSPKDFR